MVEPATIMNGERPRPPRVRLTVSESSGHTELMTSGLASQRGHAVNCKVCNTARCSDRRSVSCLRQMTWSETERERICCLTFTEARWPVRDGDEWEKGDRRVKPRNRRQPGRPRLPRTAARTTGCYGSVRPALRNDLSTTQLLSQLLCRPDLQRQCP